MTTTGEYGCHAAFNFTCASEFWGDCTFIGVMGLGKMHTEYIECVIETPYACYGTGSGIPPISKNIQNLISSEVINTGENKTFNFIGPLQVVLNELSATFTLTGGECFIEGKVTQSRSTLNAVCPACLRTLYTFPLEQSGNSLCVTVSSQQ